MDKLTEQILFQPVELIRMTAKGILDGLILVSKSGYAKSSLVLDILNNKNVDYVYKSGFSTPTELANDLWRYRDEEMLVLDDVHGLHRQKSTSLLKSAVYSATGKRTISYLTTGNQFIGNGTFEMKARVIILANTLGKPNANMEALKERGIYYRIKLTPDEIRKLMANRINTTFKEIPLNQRKKIFNYISQYCIPEVDNLNLRLFEKACKFYKHNNKKWKKLVDNHIEIDEDLLAIRKALDKFDSAKQQEKYFKRKTGKSRASFFRYKKKFLNPKR